MRRHVAMDEAGERALNGGEATKHGAGDVDGHQIREEAESAPTGRSRRTEPPAERAEIHPTDQLEDEEWGPIGFLPGAEEGDDVGVPDSGEDARLLAETHRLLFGDRGNEAFHADLAHERAAALTRAVDVCDAAAADEIEQLEAVDRFLGCRCGDCRAVRNGWLGHNLFVGTSGRKLCGFVVSSRGRTIDRPRRPRRTMNASPQPPPLVRDVASRGARVRFVEAGAGRPLVLVHDYLSSHLAWEEALPRLATRFRVIVPDLPGFGESEKPPPNRYAYGLDAFAESLADLVAAIGLSRASFCGHAMGGAVALTLAANHPHLVDRLVLVSPLVYPPRPDALTRIASTPIIGPIVFKQLYGRTVFRRHFRDRLSGATSTIPAVNESRIDYLFDLFNVPAAREAAYATMLALLDTRPLMASLSRVSAPTLIAWGRGDRISPVDQGRRLARELRGARFEVLECGHSPIEECPDAFVDVAMRFLTGAKGG